MTPFKLDASEIQMATSWNMDMVNEEIHENMSDPKWAA
jgi:hypothetical protein